MKRLVAGVVIALLIGSGPTAYRMSEGCSRWQQDFKRFRYAELLRIGPIVSGLERVEDVIGNRPIGCDVPQRLTDADIRRFRHEGVGPNEFADKERAARKT